MAVNRIFKYGFCRITVRVIKIIKENKMSNQHRKYLSIMASVFLVLSIVSCSRGNEASCRVISFLGNVSLTRGVEAPRPVVLGEELKQGDRIVTGPSSFMVFSMGDEATARIQPESDLVLTSVADLSKIDLDLAGGGVLNRVNKLAKGAGYRISTPTVVASVRGTVFSVNADEGSSTVAVKNGSVKVAVKKSDMNLDVNNGTTAVFTGTLTPRPIEEAETIILENMEFLPGDINVHESDRVEELNRQIIDKDRDINQKLKDKGIPRTLEEIKAKYERIDEVILYSGKIIRGIIVERGVYVKILTPSGYINVPSKKVRNTRVLK